MITDAGCRRSQPLRLLLYSVLTLTTAAGCQTWQKDHRAAIQHYSSGNLDQSQLLLQKSLNSRRAEQNILKLDQTVLQLASGDPLQAESQLRKLRHELDYLAQTDLAEKTSSMLTDDRAVAWSGRQFEQQMALNVLLLSSLMGNGQDAFAYALQAGERSNEHREVLLSRSSAKQPAATTQAEIMPAGFATMDKLQQPNSTPLVAGPAEQTLALAAYLSAAVQSESPLRYQETDTALRDLGLWNPRFAVSQPSADATVEFGTRCQPGHGALHVIAFVGRAPDWVPEPAMPTSASLLIADRILSATGKHTLPPTISVVKIARPLPVRDTPPIGLLRCRVADARFAVQVSQNSADHRNLPFQTLVDLNAVAEAEYRATRDHELARAVTRRIIKKGAVYVLKETQKIHRNTAVDLLTNVAGVAWEAMEQPDTRSWSLLPARVDVARTELPVGTWQTSLSCGSFSQSTIPVRIEDGRNTFVLCFVPQHALAGRILVGGADQAAFSVSP